MIAAGGLRSTRPQKKNTDQLQHYYAPLRLLSRPQHGYAFPRHVVTPRTHEEWHRNRSLRFPVVLSTSAVSNHPGKLANRCRFVRLFAMQASPNLAGWPLPLASRGRIPRLMEQGHAFALRLTPSLLQAPNGKSPRRPLKSLHGSRTFAMMSSFQLTRTTRLRLTHQITTDPEGMRATDRVNSPQQPVSNQ